MSDNKTKIVVNNDIYDEIESSNTRYGNERLIIISDNDSNNLGIILTYAGSILASFVFGYTINIENYKPYGYLVFALFFISVLGLMTINNTQKRYYKVKNK